MNKNKLKKLLWCIFAIVACYSAGILAAHDLLFTSLAVIATGGYALSRVINMGDK